MKRFSLLALALLPAAFPLLTPVFAQSGPQPPCGVEAVPVYPLLNQPATVKSWSKHDLGQDWEPPSCSGWTTAGFTTLVTTVGRFQAGSGPSSVLQRIGAISRLGGTRYWSRTKRQWRTMITEAHALTGGPGGRRRGDFEPQELKPGATVYFEQDDNIAGKAVYRLGITEASEDRIVFGMENTGPLRYFAIPVWQPGEMQMVCFLDREPDGVWRYYSMVRTGKHVNALLAGNEASAMNRALAYYRSLAGIPTDREPPAAR